MNFGYSSDNFTIEVTRSRERKRQGGGIKEGLVGLLFLPRRAEIKRDAVAAEGAKKELDLGS